MPPTQETQLRHDKSFSIDAKGGRGVGGGACKPELNKIEALRLVSSKSL